MCSTSEGTKFKIAIEMAEALQQVSTMTKKKAIIERSS